LFVVSTFIFEDILLAVNANMPWCMSSIRD